MQQSSIGKTSCEVYALNIFFGIQCYWWDDHVVEIDESAWAKRKYHWSRNVGTQSVFGGIDGDTGECFVVLVDRRDAATLLPIIHQYILPGTTIYSGQWWAYNAINSDASGPDRYVH